MEDRPLKQRLIGAIVLVALAVIFIPMLLNGRSEGSFGGSNIPPQPAEQKEVKVLRLDALPQAPSQSGPTHVLIGTDLPARPAAQAKVAEADHGGGMPSTAAPASGKVLVAVAGKVGGTSIRSASKAATPNAPKAWVVQVGSFSRQANALALRDRLRTRHFPAFVDAIAGVKGPVYRVQVGPELRRSSATALQKRLRKAIKTRTLVMAYPG